MIEFVKDYSTRYPNYYVEFDKRNPVGYMKIKGHELWLHEDSSGKLFFDKIRNDCINYIKRQPRILWFDYLSTNDPSIFRVYKFTGSCSNWVEGVIDKQSLHQIDFV